MSLVSKHNSLVSISANRQTAGQHLRQSFSAMRLAFSWYGIRKSLSSEQRLQAASQFGAEGKSISAGKKLIDSSHPAIKAVNQVKRQIVDYWKGNSLPYPESGTRLVRRDALEDLDNRMAEFQRELDAAVREVDLVFEEIKVQARERLGSLYCESDYPNTMLGEFEVFWEFPNIEPPEYLRRLQPELYQQECERIRNRFEEAAQLAEEAFVEELSRLVTHLGERLSGAEDGKPKVFRDSAVENLTDFFERFQRLNISSSQELDALVSRAQGIVQGIQPQTLRADATLRQRVNAQLSSVQSVLDGLMVDRPRRRVLR